MKHCFVKIQHVFFLLCIHNKTSLKKKKVIGVSKYLSESQKLLAAQGTLNNLCRNHD